MMGEQLMLQENNNTSLRVYTLANNNSILYYKDGKLPLLYFSTFYKVKTILILIKLMSVQLFLKAGYGVVSYINHFVWVIKVSSIKFISLFFLE